MKKVAIFDLDGVLFNSIDLMNKLTLDQYKNITLEDARKLHKMNIHEALEKVTWEKVDETPEESKERFRIYMENKRHTPLYEGIKELVEELSKEYVLVINTSALEENCTPLLEKESIAQYFDFIAAREVHSSKVEKFILISEKYQQPVADMIFITDTIGDLKESAIVEIPTIAVTWGMHFRKDFEEERYGNLVAVVDNMEELEAAIRNQLS